MSVYQFPVSPGRYIRLGIPGSTLTPVEWDRMMTVLALFRDGLVDEPVTEVVTMSGQRLRYDLPYEEVE